MIREILIVSNSKEFSNDNKEYIIDLIHYILENKKEVHIFKEDLRLYDLVRNIDGVKFINGLSPDGGDSLLFNRLNEGFYRPEDKLIKVGSDYKDIYKKATTRYLAPKISNSFDKSEFNSRRESVMYNRLRFAISNISNTYRFIINIQSTRDLNLLNSLKPAHGDGKFIYNYNCIKERGEFAVGGSYLKDTDFMNCIKEV